MQLSRRAAIATFLLLTGLWCFAFFSDAGNFWRGGTALGLIVTEGAAVLGVLAFVDVLRSDAPKLVKVLLGILALPLIAFAGFAVAYAGIYVLAV